YHKKRRKETPTFTLGDEAPRALRCRTPHRESYRPVAAYTQEARIVSMKRKRAYRYRCYPTPAQAAILARTFGCARYVYNWALRLRTDAYYKRQVRVAYHEASAALSALKQQPETAWLDEVSSQAVATGVAPPRQRLPQLLRGSRQVSHL